MFATTKTKHFIKCTEYLMNFTCIRGKTRNGITHCCNCCTKANLAKNQLLA